MDKKTKALLLVEALLIVVLVVVVAMDYNGKGTEEKVVASHEAAESEVAAEPESAVEEPAAEAEETEAPAEEAKAAEEEAVTEEAPEEAVAEKPAEEKPAAEKKAAPAKAEGSGEFVAVIPLENPAYDKHTKAIVQFTHAKHFEEYKIGCGDCHHDENAEPLKDLKPGDAVQGCIECHSKPGKAPKPQKGEKMSKSEELEYHTEALHENCISCHKEYNKKNKTKAAPATCGQCHVKK